MNIIFNESEGAKSPVFRFARSCLAIRVLKAVSGTQFWTQSEQVNQVE